MDKHRARILAENNVTKPIEEKRHIPLNNEQEDAPSANMEFIHI
jgi:hypothetical protein